MASQTAEVIEFRCQYTLNLTQKKKKWNDGNLKYHTFNKLIRVSDEHANQIGQKHWQGSDLQDGEELELDNYILVTVGEAVRSTQTDIAPLFERRRQPLSSNRQQSQPLNSISNRPTLPQASSEWRPLPSPNGLSAHRSLNSLLGSSRPPIGKAQAPVSPFNERHAIMEENDENQPTTKRRRVEGSPTQRSWTVTSTTKAPSLRLDRQSPSKRASNRVAPSLARRLANKSLAGQRTLSVKQVIDLTTSSPELPLEDDVVEVQGPLLQPVVAPIRTNTAQSSRVRSGNPPASAEQTIIQRHDPVTNFHESEAVTTGSIATPSRRENPRAQPLRLRSRAPQRTLLCIQPDLNSSVSNARSQFRATSRMIADTNVQVQTATNAQSVNPLHQALESTMPPPPVPINRATRESRAAPVRSVPQPIEATDDFFDAFSSSQAFEDVIGDDAPNNVRDPAIRSIAVEHQSRQISDSAFNFSSIELPADSVQEIQTSPSRSGLRRSQSDSHASLNRNNSTVDDAVERPVQSVQGMSRRTENDNSHRPPTITPNNQARGRTTLRRAQTTVATGFRLPIPSSPLDEPLDADLGPWSREAFDLFDWRPPDWEARLSKMPSTIGMVD